MSECTQDCSCERAKARRLMEAHGLGDLVAMDESLIDELVRQIVEAKGQCPQSCGKVWPDCLCPTAEIKTAVMERAEYVKSRKAKKPRNEGFAAMMMRLNASREG